METRSSLPSRPVIVGGYGGSGSSAAIDLLREYEGFHSIVPELRILTDPDGLLSLLNVIERIWSPYQSDIAIKRFERLIDRVSKRGGAPYHNQNFNKTICPSFESLSREYIGKITKMTYKGMWVGINDRRSVVFRKAAKLFGKPSSYAKTINISCGGDEVAAETREYLRKLLHCAAGENRAIIDEGYSSILGDRVLSLFDDARLIIVQRDPRDTFVNAIKYSYAFVPRDIDGYIIWYKAMMDHQESNSHSKAILRIRFEDLVEEYSSCVSKIEDFIGIDASDHFAAKKYFDPSVSAKNVGLWKNHPDSDAMLRIGSELAEYCRGS